MTNVNQIFKIKQTVGPKFSRPTNQSPEQLEDYSVKKNINILEGTVEQIPTDSNHIVNKAYVDSVHVTAGSDRYVQYNNNGLLGADSGFVYTGSGVGINTTAPNASLEVVDTIQILVEQGNDVTHKFYRDSNDGIIDVYTNNTVTGRIAANENSFLAGGNLTIGSDANAARLDVREANTSNIAVQISRDGSDLERTEFIRSRSSSGGTNLMERDLNSSSTAGPVFYVIQDNAGDDQHAQAIKNDGTGNGLFIDQNGNGRAIDIESAATSLPALRITNSGINTNNVAQFVQDNAASSGDSVFVKNDGTGNGLFIDQNGNGDSLLISHTSTQNGILVTGESGTQRASGTALLNLSDEDTSNTRPTFRLVNAGIGEGAYIKQDGNAAAIWVDHNANGVGIKLDMAGTQPAIKLEQAQDVEVIDFDSCTDGGTGHTTVAGSVKVQMPNGSTGYINVYT